MSNKEKIRKLEADLQMATNMLNHMAGMIVPMTDGLKYIAGMTKEEQDRRIILLKGMGAPKHIPADQVEPKVVATECLALVAELQKNFRDEGYRAKPHLSVAKGPEEIKMKDGDEIVFSTEFDVLYHECCSCGQLHSVLSEWDFSEIDSVTSYDARLITKWTQIDSLPTEAEITEAGHAVIRRKDLQ